MGYRINVVVFLTVAGSEKVVKVETERQAQVSLSYEMLNF